MAAKASKLKLVTTAVSAGEETAWLQSMFERARRGGRFIEQGVDVTPTLAAAMLVCNHENRLISDTYVSTYAADMRAGRWMINGETIKFSMGGDLNDGQHRLYAAFAYDLTFPADVAFGLPRESRLTVDQGKKRSAGDILQISSGAPAYVNAVAAAVRLLLKLDGVATNPSAVEVASAVARYQGIDEWARPTNRLYATLRTPTAGQALALWYMFARSDPDLARSFLERLIEGVDFTSSDDPVFKLRKRLVSNAISRRRPPATDVLAICIKAWNAYRAGAPIKGELRYRQRDDEEFPKVQ